MSVNVKGDPNYGNLETSKSVGRNTCRSRCEPNRPWDRIRDPVQRTEHTVLVCGQYHWFDHRDHQRLLSRRSCGTSSNLCSIRHLQQEVVDVVVTGGGVDVHRPFIQSLNFFKITINKSSSNCAPQWCGDLCG